MNPLIAYIRIERPNYTPTHVNAYDSFDDILELFDSTDKDFKDIEVGTILEIEGIKYQVTNLILKLRNNISNTENPAYDYNVEIEITVNPV